MVWFAYVDGQRFLAWRIPHDPHAKDTSDDAEAYVRAPIVPEGTRWNRVDAIEDFEREHWRCEGTMIYLLLLEVESLTADDATRRVTQLLEQRGVLYFPIWPMRAWMGSPGLETFMESVPE